MGLPSPCSRFRCSLSCSKPGSSLCNIPWTLRCRFLEFQGIVWSPSARSRPLRCWGFPRPNSFLRLSQLWLEVRWHFALRSFSSYPRWSAVIHTSTRSSYDHRLKLPAHQNHRWFLWSWWFSKHPGLFQIPNISRQNWLCHRLGGMRTCRSGDRLGFPIPRLWSSR